MEQREKKTIIPIFFFSVIFSHRPVVKLLIVLCEPGRDFTSDIKDIQIVKTSPCGLCSNICGMIPRSKFALSVFVPEPGKFD